MVSGQYQETEYRKFLPMFQDFLFFKYPCEDQVRDALQQGYHDILLGLPDHSVSVMNIMIEDGQKVDAGIAVSPEFIQDIKFKLSRIERPVLLINGSNDHESCMKAGRMYHDYVEHSILRIIRRCGHDPPAQCPEAFFLTLRRFLDDVL